VTCRACVAVGGPNHADHRAQPAVRDCCETQLHGLLQCLAITGITGLTLGEIQLFTRGLADQDNVLSMDCHRRRA
jgi:hypothetical protein